MNCSRSTLSRYIESDPLGLGGGDFSTYGYAKSDPVANTDPNGEDAYPFVPGSPGVPINPSYTTGPDQWQQYYSPSLPPEQALQQACFSIRIWWDSLTPTERLMLECKLGTSAAICVPITFETPTLKGKAKVAVACQSVTTEMCYMATH